MYKLPEIWGHVMKCWRTTILNVLWCRTSGIQTGNGAGYALIFTVQVCREPLAETS